VVDVNNFFSFQHLQARSSLVARLAEARERHAIDGAACPSEWLVGTLIVTGVSAAGSCRPVVLRGMGERTLHDRHRDL